MPLVSAGVWYEDELPVPRPAPRRLLIVEHPQVVEPQGLLGWFNADPPGPSFARSARRPWMAPAQEQNHPVSSYVGAPLQTTITVFGGGGRVYVGSRVLVTATFRDKDQAATDPLRVKAVIEVLRNGEDVERRTDLVYQTDTDLVRVSAGVYRINLHCAFGGSYSVGAFAFGAGEESSDELTFVVLEPTVKQ